MAAMDVAFVAVYYGMSVDHSGKKLRYVRLVVNIYCSVGNKQIYLTPLFCGDLCYYLIRKRCYRSENHAIPL